MTLERELSFAHIPLPFVAAVLFLWSPHFDVAGWVRACVREFYHSKIYFMQRLCLFCVFCTCHSVHRIHTILTDTLCSGRFILANRALVSCTAYIARLERRQRQRAVTHQSRRWFILLFGYGYYGNS